MAKKGSGSKKQAVGKKPVKKDMSDKKGAPQAKAGTPQTKSAAPKSKSTATKAKSGTSKAKSSAYKTKSGSQSKLNKLLKGGGCLLPLVSMIGFAILLSLSLL